MQKSINQNEQYMYIYQNLVRKDSGRNISFIITISFTVYTTIRVKNLNTCSRILQSDLYTDTMRSKMKLESLESNAFL